MACIAWHRDRLDACTSFSFVYFSAQHEVSAACVSSRIWPGFTGPTCSIDQQGVSSSIAYMYVGSKVVIIPIQYQVTSQVEAQVMEPLFIRNAIPNQDG